MAGRGDKQCRVVFWHSAPGDSPLPVPDRDLQSIELLTAESPGAAHRLLGRKGEAILLLTSLGEDAAALVKGLRAQEGWRDLPVFAIVASARIDEALQRHADELAVELLPWPMPEDRFWRHLREAAQKYRLQLYRTRLNRRKHFRTPLAVTAFCPVEVRTVDISIAGVQFLTGHTYRKGERGMLDIPSLREIIGSSFAFEVVSVESAKDADFSHRVRARFVEMDAGAIRKLEKALAMLETYA